MNMDNIILLLWWLSPKLPCKMFNTVYPGGVLTLEKFSIQDKQGMISSKAAGARVWWVTAEALGHSEPRARPLLTCKLSILTAGHELHWRLGLVPGPTAWRLSSPSHPFIPLLGPRQLSITKGLVQRQTAPTPAARPQREESSSL